MPMKRVACTKNMIIKPKLSPTRTNFTISQYVGRSLHTQQDYYYRKQGPFQQGS